jgi:hypothetical protein
MKIKIACLMIMGIVMAGAWNIALAEEQAIPALEDAGWVTYKDKQIILMYPADINLKRLEARLRSRYFHVSAIEKDLFTNPAYDVQERIMARLESILLRAKQLLAMYPDFSVKLKVFRNRAELSDEYFRIFNSVEKYKSFYVHALGTIYTSMQDVSDSEISHEMSHAVIDHYFSVLPPSKVAELLATYVDSHLERE